MFYGYYASSTECSAGYDMKAAYASMIAVFVVGSIVILAFR